MSPAEARATFATGKLQPPIPGSNSSKYLSELRSKVEAFDNRSVSGRQEVVEFILDKNGYDSLKFVDQHSSKGIDAIKVNYEGVSGTGYKNIGIPKSQIGEFNSVLKRVR